MSITTRMAAAFVAPGTKAAGAVRLSIAMVLAGALTLAASGGALAQQDAARQLLEQAADAMGGQTRITAIDNLHMSGFGLFLNQQGGSAPSADPMAPPKWQAAHAVDRWFDLAGARALNRDRRSFLFPFAAEFGHSWDLRQSVQRGSAALDHPLPALRAALAGTTTTAPVTMEEGRPVVQFTTADGTTAWLGLDGQTHLPAWVRWTSGSDNLGDVTYTAWFTGYLPFDGIRLPVGITTTIDWRDTQVSAFHVDSYTLNDLDMPAFPDGPGAGGPPGASGTPAAPQAVVDVVAPGVWDVRVGGNGGAVIEFEDHLVMYEAYGSEAATLARIAAANELVPGKRVTAVIVSHHHFDHTGGLRAAVAEGLTVIAHRGNEALFRDMISRPAPNFPDSLARNPQPLRFVAVDERLRLEDDTMRVEIFHAIGHLHMAEAVVAWIPHERIFIEGDFTTWNWDWHWWGDAYLDTIEHYGLDPAINIPVHGRVMSFADTVAAIEEQVQRATRYCEDSASAGVFPAGCPVRYRRGSD